MSTTRYLQRFGEDAIYMTEIGWKLIYETRPGDGIYRKFKFRRYEIYVLILPSTGYPATPPIVVFLSHSEEVFYELSHLCLWSDEIPFIGSAPEWLRSLLMDKSYAKRILHILEGNEGLWGRLLKSSKTKNRLQAINNFLENTLKLKPIN
jgi:hypothetical protein